MYQRIWLLTAPVPPFDNFTSCLQLISGNQFILTKQKATWLDKILSSTPSHVDKKGTVSNSYCDRKTFHHRFRRCHYQFIRMLEQLQTFLNETLYTIITITHTLQMKSSYVQLLFPAVYDTKPATAKLDMKNLNGCWENKCYNGHTHVLGLI